MSERPAFFYYLDSPFAWLAAERLEEVFGAGVEWVPILLGAVFKARGRTSWGFGEGRAAGIAEVERRARERGVGPVVWPDPWPSDGLRAMRGAVHAHAAGVGEAFALGAYGAVFRSGLSLSDPDVIVAGAHAAGLDPDAVLAATADPEVKDALRANTDRALAAGVFGVPTVLAAGEVIWGDDDLERAARLVA